MYVHCGTASAQFCFVLRRLSTPARCRTAGQPVSNTEEFPRPQSYVCVINTTGLEEVLVFVSLSRSFADINTACRKGRVLERKAVGSIITCHLQMFLFEKL